MLETLRTSAEDVDEPFLLRWLRAKDYDLDEAEFSIRAHAAWRAEHVTPGGVREVCKIPMQFLCPSDLGHHHNTRTVMRCPVGPVVTRLYI